MPTQFKLTCETIHCFGKKNHDLGNTETKEEAQRWVEDRQQHYKRSLLPEDDPIRSCPVVRCPFKLQDPRFSYEESELV